VLRNKAITSDISGIVQQTIDIAYVTPNKSQFTQFCSNQKLGCFGRPEQLAYNKLL